MSAIPVTTQAKQLTTMKRELDQIFGRIRKLKNAVASEHPEVLAQVMAQQQRGGVEGAE